MPEIRIPIFYQFFSQTAKTVENIRYIEALS